MSAKTGRAPTNSAALAEATKVKGDEISSSPSLRPCASIVRCRAAVPELTATAWATPHHAANSDSNFSTSGPCASCPLSRTASTARRSSSPISGAATGIIFSVSNSTSCYGLHHSLRGVAVAKQVGAWAVRTKAVHRLRNRAGIGPDQPIPARRHRLRPLGGATECDTWFPGEVRLFLHAARIGDDRLRVFLEHQYLEVPDRIDKSHVAGAAGSTARQHLASPRMDRKHRRPPGFRHAVEDRREPCRIVRVLSAMHREKLIAPR